MHLSKLLVTATLAAASAAALEPVDDPMVKLQATIEALHEHVAKLSAKVDRLTAHHDLVSEAGADLDFDDDEPDDEETVDAAAEDGVTEAGVAEDDVTKAVVTEQGWCSYGCSPWAHMAESELVRRLPLHVLTGSRAP